MRSYQYQIGGSLSSEHPTYVERQADLELYKSLHQGKFCYVLNCRQMGKSSLLVRTKQRLEHEGFKCVALDLTSIGSEQVTPLQWYKGIIANLWMEFCLFKTLNLQSWWQSESDLSLLQRLSQFIEVLLQQFPQEHLVILIDEIDSVLTLDFAVDDFFAFIRFCYNQRAINPEYQRITFAIFGVATPSDLIKDRNRTPFNIGKSIELEGFKLEEAYPLLGGFSSRFNHPSQILREILHWTGGQPFLTQKLCELVTELTVNPDGELGRVTEELLVEKVVRSQILEHWESQDEPEHLKTIRNRLNHHQQRKGRLLGIYQQILQGTEISANDSHEHTELILSGLVVKCQGSLKVKNRIYANVFNQTWVASELGKLRPYSQTLDAWITSHKTDESRLLRGQALKDAQLWAQDKSLSDLDYQFLATSVEVDRREVQLALESERTKAIEIQLKEQQQKAKLQKIVLGAISVALLISSSLGLFAFRQYRQARISEIKALASSSEGLFASNHQLDAMIDAIKAEQKLQSLGVVDSKTTKDVKIALKQTVYGNNEFNRLNGHKSPVVSVDISPDDQLDIKVAFLMLLLARIVR